MINEKNIMRGAVLTLAVCVAAVGYNQTRARADGIPATSPLVYSGTLEESGAVLTGMVTRNLRLTVWDDATSTESVHSRCTTTAPGTAVNGGRFQLTLDAMCSAVVRSTPDLWVELEVNGTPLGRTKITAVPFAMESARAAGLTPAASNLLVPSGTVVAFAGDRVPAGWLLCDGAAVSQTTYAALFSAIGTSHGSGGATGMFNVPDYRGRFLRGVDGMAGRDLDAATRTAAHTGGNTGNAVGTIEGDAYRSHAHGVTDPGHTHDMWNVYAGANLPAGGFNYAGAVIGTATGSRTTGISIQASGGGETRPVNAAVNYIIKI